MQVGPSVRDYGWGHEYPHTTVLLVPAVRRLLERHLPGRPSRVLDLGCGNGAVAAQLHAWGCDVTGVDPGASSITMARSNCPAAAFHRAEADPAQLAALGLPPFDAVVSTEVVEHCYQPRMWARAAYEALRPGGLLVCSTPYHGYLKNVALALTGRLDAHFTALWDGGHIKFWSRRTLTALLHEAGFHVVGFAGAGRLPWLWRSMLLAARKPPAI